MILLIEDEILGAQAIIRALRESGIRKKVLHADTGGKALGYLKGGYEIDTIIADVNIVGMIETPFLIDSLKRKRRTRQIPIIITSIAPPNEKTQSLMKKYPELRFVSKDQDFEDYKKNLTKTLFKEG